MSRLMLFSMLSGCFEILSVRKVLMNESGVEVMMVKGWIRELKSDVSIM